MNLPNFFLAGPPKAGTTSLHRYLRQHPQVYMNPIKEPTFFASADLRAREDFQATVARERPALQAYLDGPQEQPAHFWVTEWDDYVAMFRNVRHQTAIGEASVSYFWMPSAAPAIRAKLPGARLVFLLRDPADRLVAWHMMSVRREPRLTFRDWFRRALNGAADRGPAIEGGRFATHLQRFRDHFPPEQMRVYVYESLQADAPGLVRDLLGFLGVDPNQPIDLSRRHQVSMVPRFPRVDRLRRRILGGVPLTSWLPAPAARALQRLYNRGRRSFALLPEDRRMVVDFYRDEILRTADLIGRDLSAWLR